MEHNKINHGNKISLLIGGKQAFPVILQEIRNCRESIYICMFVWREDRIGKQIARELLLAADRGVKIVIDKDRYGILCECSEENRNSLFHKDPFFQARCLQQSRMSRPDTFIPWPASCLRRSG